MSFLSGDFETWIEKHATQVVRFRALGILVESILALKKDSNARLNALEQEIAAMRTEITAVKAQPCGLSYAGTWQRERPYGKDTGVTHHGSLWVATRPTTLEPGGTASGWQLAVKRGRDGKDA